MMRDFFRRTLAGAALLAAFCVPCLLWAQDGAQESFEEWALDTAKQRNLEFATLQELMLWARLGDALYDVTARFEKGDPEWWRHPSLQAADVTEDGKSLVLSVVGADSGLTIKLTEVVQRHGAEVLHTLSDREVEVVLPVGRLKDLGMDADVRSVRTRQPVVATAIKSAGWRATRAQWWQQAGRIDGGTDVRNPGFGPVKIAIVDYFDAAGLPELTRNGDAPADAGAAQPRSGQYKYYDLVPTPVTGRLRARPNDHGNQMLALAYRNAPGAAYYLIDADRSPAGIADALRFAQTLAPDIINLAVVSQIDRYPFSGPGPIQEAQRSAFSNGALVVAGAGNDGELGKHWSGRFMPVGITGQFLNWANDTATAAPHSGLALGSGFTALFNGVAVNSLGCFATTPRSAPPLDQFDAPPIDVSVGLPHGDPENYTLYLMQHIANANWRPVRGASDSRSASDSRRILRHFVDLTRDIVDPVTPQADHALHQPLPACPAGQARYGLAIFRRTVGNEPDPGPGNYINVFLVDNNARLQVGREQASLAESNLSETTVTVGAAVCAANTSINSDEGCVPASPASYSSQGPAVRNGMQPMNLEAPEYGDTYLTDQSYGFWLWGAVKPDFVAPSPTYNRAGASGGTSGATTMVTSMAALLLQRYRGFFNRNPTHLKYALMRLAERRDVDLPAVYARVSYYPGLRYEDTRASYKYGRGYLRLERESGISVRGQINHVRISSAGTPRPLRSSPMSDGVMRPPIDGSWTYWPAGSYSAVQIADPRYGNNLGPSPVLYFTQRGSSQPVYFPVLTPRFEFNTARDLISTQPPVGQEDQGAFVTDFRGGDESEQLVPREDAGGLPEVRENVLQRAGWFRFANMQFTRTPLISPNIGRSYTLLLRAARVDGSLLYNGRPDDMANNSADCPASECTFSGSTNNFNVCRADYRPPERDTCPID